MAASVTAFVACGPSAEEKARIEQARQDSIEQVRVQDSLNAAEAVARQQAIQDSIVMADSLRMVAMQDSMAKMKANMTKPKPKPNTFTSIAPCSQSEPLPYQLKGKDDGA